MNIHLVEILSEDFVNYKYPSLILAFPYCNMKCNKECGLCVCQNDFLLNEKIKEYDIDKIIMSYISNDITKAIVMQGLEPLDSIKEVLLFIDQLRNVYDIQDDVVIYTGYNEDEISNELDYLRTYSNIIVKFGRYLPNQEKHYDEVLQVELASDNQYAKKIS